MVQLPQDAYKGTTEECAVWLESPVVAAVAGAAIAGLFALVAKWIERTQGKHAIESKFARGVQGEWQGTLKHLGPPTSDGLEPPEGFSNEFHVSIKRRVGQLLLRITLTRTYDGKVYVFEGRSRFSNGQRFIFEAVSTRSSSDFAVGLAKLSAKGDAINGLLFGSPLTDENEVAATSSFTARRIS
jgi:hypothetical protein